MDQAQLIGIVIGLGAVAILLLIVFLKANIVICQPNEILVLAGRKRKLEDGTVVGYRVLRGGRGFKKPLVESVKRLTLTSRTVDIRIAEVLCAGMIPVSIDARANVKLAGREDQGLENAVERFLDQGIENMERTARQILEGTLRGVASKIGPEEANTDRIGLAATVTKHVSEVFGKMGIVLDSFHIQSISDSQDYLGSIGRKRVAEVQRDAKIAEARAEAEALTVSADQMRLGREAQVSADRAIVAFESEFNIERERLRAEVRREEKRADLAGDIVRAEEEAQLEEKRVAVVAKREEADTIVPAEARKRASLLDAEGEAARILEDGKATAEAVSLMLKQWNDGSSRDLFLIQMLPDLLDKVTRVVADNLTVEKLTILDGGDGNGLPGYMKNLANSTAVLLEHMKTSTGIDLANLGKPNPSSGTRELPKG